MKTNKDVKKVKVLFFISSLCAGGKERQLVELLKGLVNHKTIDCELAVMSNEIHYNVVFNLNIKLHYLIRKKKIDFKLYFKIYKMLKKIKPDIVHVWDRVSGLHVLPFVKRSGIKYLYGAIRGAAIKKYSKIWFIDKVNFLFADKVVANSYSGLGNFDFKIKRSMVIYNGFDMSRVKNLSEKTEIKKIFGINTPKIVGMIGSLDGRKDSFLFLKAAKKILSKRDDVTFLIIGEGRELDTLKSMINPNEKEYIKYVGRQDNIESIVNVFDIGVLTSKNQGFIEGISNSIMEYMALGKPVVATNGGGTPEIVIDNITGFLVKPKDLNDLVNKIIYLLDNENVSIKMGKAGQERIGTDFHSEKMINSYLGIYKKK